KHMEMTLGVTGPQRLTIRIIGRFPGITAGHLAKLLHIHPGTLSGIIKRLERQGLIRRRPDTRDGRRSLLGLTEKGRLLETGTEALVEGVIEQIFERTPLEKLQATRDVLESIAMQLSNSLVDESARQGMAQHSKPLSVFIP
ncbi:MAG TPA: MarR family transcriptional regulator, partial [Polyangiaceae bacterium]|nr:MarR family transcriptional regulator [Polyangiaceae bacterium]